MRLKAAWAGALLAAAVVATPAQAQINFYTTGAFSGACAGTSCNLAGLFNLSYTGQATNPADFASGSQVNLGKFTQQSLGNGTLPSNIFFTLTIHQTNPTTNTGTAVGDISGTVAINPDGSTMIWTPSPNPIVIDGVTYQVIYDNFGYAKDTGVGIAVDASTDIKAIVATPEPASMTLLATGLVGIFGTARRRRKSIA